VLKIRLMFLFTVFAIMVPASVMAEGFADLYIGFAQSQEQDLSTTIGGTSTDDKAEFQGDISGGYRLGYWFEKMPVGIALDLSYFEQDIEDLADLSVMAVSPLLMLKVPLHKSAEFPNGEWQPYVGAGMGFFMSELEPDGAGDKNEQSDWGLDARCGIKKFFQYNVALLIEYRYTQFTPEFDSEIDEFDLQTHHALFGVSVTF